MKSTLSNLPMFGVNYSPTKLFDKLSQVAKKAGLKTVYAVLLLYYALLDGNIPFKDKAIVIGALGYFILPVDAIPDFLPGGYVDDAGAAILALKSIWNNITPNIKAQARKRLSAWFGTVSDADLKLF